MKKTYNAYDTAISLIAAIICFFAFRWGYEIFWNQILSQLIPGLMANGLVVRFIPADVLNLWAAITSIQFFFNVVGEKN